MKHIFIINPTAGKSDQTKYIANMVNKIFMEEDIEGTYRIEVTKGVHDATDIARHYAMSNEPVRIYSCGGDGTLNEIVNGIVHYENVELAPVPIGSGNDFVKSFDQNAITAFLDLKALIKASARKIDLLEVNGHFSINVINIGFDSSIAQNMVRFKHLPLVGGAKAYDISVFYSFMTSIKNRFEIIADGIRLPHKNYTFAVMANGQYYGGSYRAAPLSDMQDGLIDLVLIPSVSRLKILQLMNVYKRGDHLQEQYQKIVHYRQCHEVQVEADHEINVCIDGEIKKLKNPKIIVHPNHLKLVVPEISKS